MNKRKLRRDSCAGKRHWPDLNTARRTLQRWFPDRDVVNVLHAYQCGFCHAWHIGASAERQWRSRRAV